jgi:hypothetical protein
MNIEEHKLSIVSARLSHLAQHGKVTISIGERAWVLIALESLNIYYIEEPTHPLGSFEIKLKGEIL